MAMSIRVSTLSLLLIAGFASGAHAQYPFTVSVGMGNPIDVRFGMCWGPSTNALDVLARQAVYQRQNSWVSACCHPPRANSTWGPAARPELRLQHELPTTTTQGFCQTGCIRQHNPGRQRRRFSQADVRSLREHRDALPAVMAINRELATDRARRAAPGRPDVDELDPLTGAIGWPALLLDNRFADDRYRLEAIFAERARRGESDATIEVRQVTQSMRLEIKSRIQEVAPESYSRAKTLLGRLDYETRFTPMSTGLASATNRHGPSQHDPAQSTLCSN